MLTPHKSLLCALLMLTGNTLKALEGFSLIPQGEFTMGPTIRDYSVTDIPTRTVTLDAFYMGKYEVTKAEWDEVRAWGLSNGYTDLVAGSGKASNHPVQTISWYMMLKWCNARSQKEGLTPVYYTNDAQTTIYKTGSVDVTKAQVKWAATGYRLPTEAEWEKAARGGADGMRFPWTDSDAVSHDKANFNNTGKEPYQSGPTGYHASFYDKNERVHTSPVGYFLPNDYELYDMSGNIAEYCWDRDGDDTGERTNPKGPDLGAYRIIRGGSWLNQASVARVAFRSRDNPKNPAVHYGFRVVRKQTIDGDYAGNFNVASSRAQQDIYDYSCQISLKINESGAYSGALVNGGNRLGLKGNLDPNAKGEIIIKPNSKKRIFGATIKLSIELMSDNQYCVAASIQWPDQPSADFICYPVAYTGKGGASDFPLAGKMINNLLISRGESGVKFGHGYASTKASKDGALAITGRMADGSTLTGATRLVRNDAGQVVAPISFPISAVRGLLHGEGHVNIAPDVGDVNLFAPSGLEWLRLPQAKSKTFKQGFTVKLDLYGQVWSWQKGQSAMPAGESGFGLTLDPEMSVLEKTLELVGTWPASNKPAWTPVPPKGFTFGLKTATGAFSGNAPRTVAGKAAKAIAYQGLMLSPGIAMDDGSTLTGGGFILGSESSGAVEITTP
jgi:sulfatase modifying factor 1